MAKTMPDALFVDTGYVIALINPNDQHHSQALPLAERYDGHPLVTTDAILLEIGNALSRFARNEAATIIRYFQTAPEVTLVPLTPVFPLLSWETVACLRRLVLIAIPTSRVYARDLTSLHLTCNRCFIP
jgi:predicted nucleic acid-binding protein